jgi:hypothetical protein
VNSRWVGGNFDLRGLGGGMATAIFKHDIPAVYAQYVDGLRIHDFVLQWETNLPDYFSDGIHCEHFADLNIDGFQGGPAPNHGSSAAISLQHGHAVSIRNCQAEPGTATFLSLADVQDQRLFVDNDLLDAARPTRPEKTNFKIVSGNAGLEK